MNLPPPALPHCTRHPERVTGRSCTRCGRPACGDCLVQADVGSKCVDCIRRDRPDVRTRARYWNAANPIVVTKVLIALNVLVFIYTNMSGVDLGGSRLNNNSINLGLAKIFLVEGEWYRLVTCGFLHFGVFHIAMNMFLLYQLGTIIEPDVGRTKFALTYVAALLAGSTGALIANPNSLTGGASGAVFGLMGAAFIGLRLRGINPMQTGLGLTLVLNLVLTFSVSGISIGGHVGGLVGGVICGYFLFAPPKYKFPAWLGFVAPIAVSLAAFVAAYSLI